MYTDSGVDSVWSDKTSFGKCISMAFGNWTCISIYEYYLSTIYVCYMVCIYQGTPAGIIRFVRLSGMPSDTVSPNWSENSFTTCLFW